ncbi:helix-turn-helix transcriptional regulator [Micromonospora echinospora]|uniref:helix-turn-helix domain-containing protein n=1 Tax=Micromonospora echinospora TaxID=1877 RepID=UPI0033FB2826
MKARNGGRNELPIGRRVAQWRVRRGMTQQMLADRLGRSKSWVDKVERGVRRLDRFPVIQDVAGVLRVDAAVLLGRPDPPAAAAAVPEGVDGIRTALACYDATWSGPDSRPLLSLAELDRQIGHAWLTYQHAHHARLLRLLPTLIGDSRRAHARYPDRAADLLVQVYRITSSVLVKVGEGEVAWLAADRAMAVAAGHPVRVAVASVPLAPALRAVGRAQLAMAATIAAAQRIGPGVSQAPPAELSLHGTLLLQAAISAAACADAAGAGELVGHAAEVAEEIGDGRDHHWTAFGPTAVDLARVVVAVELGDGVEAVARHQTVVRRGTWSRLPVEHRAAYLIDVARAHLQAGDLAGAGRTMVEADRIAAAEIRSRPVARTLVAAVLRGAPDVAHLAGLLGPPA